MIRVGALLAAGRSTRFGTQDKLLVPWRGRPLVAWPATALLQSGCDQLVAILSDDAVAAALPQGIAPRRIAKGLPMSASLAMALQVARSQTADCLLVCLGDMPNVGAGLLRALLAQPTSAACHDGHRRLPPVRIDSRDFNRVMAPQPGDHGARAFIATLPADRLLPVSRAIAHDIDRPEDMAAFTTG